MARLKIANKAALPRPIFGAFAIAHTLPVTAYPGKVHTRPSKLPLPRCNCGCYDAPKATRTNLRDRLPRRPLTLGVCSLVPPLPRAASMPRFSALTLHQKATTCPFDPLQSLE